VLLYKPAFCVDKEDIMAYVEEFLGVVAFVCFPSLHSAIEWLNIASDRYQISCSLPWGYLKETAVRLLHSPLRVVMQVCLSFPDVSVEVESYMNRDITS
jgi:hypothetical protein